MSAESFTNAFAVVSPHDGVMNSLILPLVNTQMMSPFVGGIARRYTQEFIIMGMHGGGVASRGRFDDALEDALVIFIA